MSLDVDRYATMSEDSEQKSGYSVFVWAFVAVPLLYVLSIGPVAKMFKINRSSGDTFGRIYAPVIWLHDHTLLEEPLEAYVGFWGVK